MNTTTILYKINLMHYINGTIHQELAKIDFERKPIYYINNKIETIKILKKEYIKNLNKIIKIEEKCVKKTLQKENKNEKKSKPKN